MSRSVLTLYIGNRRFRDGKDGRKIHASELLADTDPSLHFEELNLAAPTRFGQVHLPTTSDLDAVARRLALAPDSGGQWPSRRGST